MLGFTTAPKDRPGAPSLPSIEKTPVQDFCRWESEAQTLHRAVKGRRARAPRLRSHHRDRKTGAPGGPQLTRWGMGWPRPPFRGPLCARSGGGPGPLPRACAPRAAEAAAGAGGRGWGAGPKSSSSRRSDSPWRTSVWVRGWDKGKAPTWHLHFKHFYQQNK